MGAGQEGLYVIHTNTHTHKLKLRLSLSHSDAESRSRRAAVGSRVLSQPNTSMDVRNSLCVLISRVRQKALRPPRLSSAITDTLITGLTYVNGYHGEDSCVFEEQEIVRSNQGKGERERGRWNVSGGFLLIPVLHTVCQHACLLNEGNLTETRVSLTEESCQKSLVFHTHVGTRLATRLVTREC